MGDPEKNAEPHATRTPHSEEALDTKAIKLPFSKNQPNPSQAPSALVLPVAKYPNAK
jgi:hypothetical protein